MTKTIHYGCTALMGTNKVGRLRCDKDGWYDMILGALEYENSVGDIYTVESAKKFFEEGSSLMRRIANGQLRAEYGHPKKLPGMTDREYLQRILTIEETMVCCHIREVYIDYNNVKCPKTGRTIIAFRGKVKPSGPYGQYLKEMLDDPNMNVAFSVRSLTMNRMVGFRQHKDFTQIVTWDYVTEPGLAPANKYSVPTLEAHYDINFQLEDIKAIAEKRYSLESSALAREITDILRYGKPLRSKW